MPPSWFLDNSPAKGYQGAERQKALPSSSVVGMHGTGIITEHQVSVHYIALYLAVDVTLNQPCISMIF